VDNPETVATFATKDTGRRQSRDTGNIRHTRHRTKTIQRQWQHLSQKTQDKDNSETVATFATKDNPETVATLGTQDTGRRQSRDSGNICHKRHRTKTIQRQWQHLPQKTQDKDNPETVATFVTKDTGRRQSRDSGNICHKRHRTKTIQRHW
jgi:flagellar biosynthesis/type III secretory pathway chaperone